jgi:cardiolipin synthase
MSSSFKVFGALAAVTCLAVGGACSSNNIVRITGGGHDDGGAADDGGLLADGAAGDGGSRRDGAVVGPIPLTANVKIIAEPNGNDASELVAAINAATKSVHVIMYLFTSTAVENALIAKKNAGLDVKVMLNKTFPAGGSNSGIFASLQSSGISVQYAPVNLTHEKCIIIDGAVAWIMTMNTTTSAPTSNREYLAIDKDSDDVAEAEAIFEADWANMPPTTVTGKLLVAPINARERLLGLVNSATATIDIEGEEFSDTQITQAIAARADTGVKVRLVVSSATPTASQTGAIGYLKMHGMAKAVSTSNPTIHAKAIVVDGKAVYVGSANFTTGSLNYNRELGIITGAASEVAVVANAIQQDFAAGTPL